MQADSVMELQGKLDCLGTIGAHGVGVKHHRVEQRRQGIGKRRLTGARQAHDKDFYALRQNRLV
jgi:hypothetical protein